MRGTKAHAFPAMNDRALRYFLAVVRTGSVRGAAEALNVAASAVSRHISEMEAECGENLLERLTCGAGFLVDLLDNGLANFVTAYPGISFQVSLGTTDSVLSAVAQGDTDIGLAYNPPAHPDLRGVVSARQPLLAVLPKDHPLAGSSTPVGLRTFASEPVVLLPSDHGVRQLLGRVEADGGFRLVARLETASFEMHRRFVTAGLGVAFLPRFAVAAELQTDAVTVLPLLDPVLSEASAHLVVRSGRRLPEAMGRLLGWLTEHLVAFQPQR